MSERVAKYLDSPPNADMYLIFSFLILAEVGGWLGFVLGASIVSLLELIYFYILFCGVLVSYVNRMLYKKKLTIK